MAKILYVEDNEVDLEMLSRRLVNSGYEVIAAINGQQALDKVAAESPELIILDIGLPDIDGWEVARRLKAGPDTRSIPIIVLTAYTVIESREKALETGCDDFETKPIEYGGLLKKIELLVAGSRGDISK